MGGEEDGSGEERIEDEEYWERGEEGRVRARRELTAAALGLRLGLVRREESVMLVVRLVGTLEIWW